MSDVSKTDGVFRRFLQGVWSVFGAIKNPQTISAQRAAPPSAATTNEALSTQPSATDLINEGLQCRQQMGTAAARPFFERASQLEPHSPAPWFMLGNVASEIGEHDAAFAHYVRARDLNPSDHVVRYNLGLNQFLRGYVKASIEELSTACNLNPSYLPAHSTYLMALHNSDRVSPEELDVVTRRWGTRFALKHPELGKAAASLGTDGPRPIRVGFISGDFRIHSVAHFFEPILSARNRDAFTYILYSNSHSKDEITERLRACADDWRDIWDISDDALIDLIHTDRVDILVDLSGHTASNRLSVFARRAAPVQITYLGYPSSTGLPTMDYRIADGVTDPPVPADAWHCERLLRMPDTQWCFRPFKAPETTDPLPARKAGFVTFGSFNNLTKASDTLLGCWTQILARLPNSRLRLTRIRSLERAAEIIALFAQSGVAAERIDCVPFADAPPYGQQFRGVDIALDNYPYNGVTTTCESLSVGVPVISLHGRNGVSRSGLSILSALGLSELVASTPGQYTDIAVTLGSDLARLEQLRDSLQTRFERSSLRDEKRFASNFEKLLFNAWQNRIEFGAIPPSAAGR